MRLPPGHQQQRATVRRQQHQYQQHFLSILTLCSVIGVLLISMTNIPSRILSKMATATASISTTTTSASGLAPGSSRVIVVGSGLAGLSAASELASRNVPVCILERQAKPGGNSIKASSGINGTPTRFQQAAKVDQDSAAVFYDDTTRSVSEKVLTSDPSMTERRKSLISTLTNSSAAAIEWLVDDKKIDLSRVAQLGGHTYPRTHRGAGTTPPGASIVLTLLKQLKENPLVSLETGTTVTKVIKNSTTSQVVGVEVRRGGNNSSTSTTTRTETTTTDGSAQVETEVLQGPVIFASGGFAGDSKGVLAQYRPDLAGYPSTNEALPGSQSLLTDVGAALLDMDLVQLHPTGFIDPHDPLKITKFLAAEMLRGEGGILLRRGKRFVDELQTRKVVTEAITAEDPTSGGTRGTSGTSTSTASTSTTATGDDDSSTAIKQWDISLVLDQGAYEAAKAHVDFYLWKGLMRKTTIADLDPEHAHVALESIRQYAGVVKTHGHDDLGRSSFGNWTLFDPCPSSTVYIGKVTPVVHYTMGGVVFDSEARVLDGNKSPIEGLWAAGEITGGVHGANRLGGSSLLECVVFGRIAGRNAAEYYYQRKHGSQ
ncbi:Fumarate reductase 1 [Exophiala dermatitidis]